MQINTILEYKNWKRGENASRGCCQVGVDKLTNVLCAGTQHSRIVHLRKAFPHSQWANFLSFAVLIGSAGKKMLKFRPCLCIFKAFNDSILLFSTWKGNPLNLPPVYGPSARLGIWFIFEWNYSTKKANERAVISGRGRTQGMTLEAWHSRPVFLIHWGNENFKFFLSFR